MYKNDIQVLQFDSTPNVSSYFGAQMIFSLTVPGLKIEMLLSGEIPLGVPSFSCI